MRKHLAFMLTLPLMTALIRCQDMSLAQDANCGTQQIVVEGFDWGPVVSKIILTLNIAIDANSFSKASFIVKTMVEGAEKSTERIVTDAYLCDTNGIKINTAKGKHIALVMDVVKSDSAGKPFFHNEWFNKWADPYTNEITASGLKSNCLVVSDIVIDPKPIGKIVPILSNFDVDNSFTASNNMTINYAFFSPAPDSKKHPLVIWLHGMGEGTTGGGSDIAILGSNLSNLVMDKFQSIMGGAYLLVPQASTYWMDDGVAPMSMTTGANPSIYETSLWELIQDFVKNNPDINKDRIYIGGCSNGGYMTMNMAFLHPDYFAAAFPICSAFENQYATDTMIDSIKDLPIRFTHALGDEVCDPRNSIDVFNRLVEAGSDVAEISLFGPIEDNMGNKGIGDGYIQHFSWVFVLNDSYDKALMIPANTDIEESGSQFNCPGFTFQLNAPNNQKSLWRWLANQKK